MQKKEPKYFEKQNKFNVWKLRNEHLEAINPKRMLPKDFTIDVNKLPLIEGKIHFIRVVDSQGRISVLNEYFEVGTIPISQIAAAHHTPEQRGMFRVAALLFDLIQLNVGNYILIQ